MSSKRAIPLLFSFAVVTAVALLGYRYVRGRASQKVLKEALAAVDDMEMSLDDKTLVRRLMIAEHDRAFDDALHLTAERGRQFDGEGYFTALFDGVIAAVRREGRDRLADSIDRQRRFFTFSVSEQ